MAKRNDGPGTAKAKQATSEPVTVERLREVLTCDPASGALVWKERGNRRFDAQFAGKPALACRSGGRLAGMLDGHLLRTARVVWALTVGYWPSGRLVHRNGDPYDVRPDNLALSSDVIPSRRLRSDNRLGLRGVRETRAGRFEARLRVSGRVVSLGIYDTPEKAAAAVQKCTRLRSSVKRPQTAPKGAGRAAKRAAKG